MKITKRLFYLLLPALCINSSTTAQNNWTLKKNADDIKVYSRKVENSKFDEVKVECTIKGTLSQLAAVLLDVNDHGKWIYSTKTSYLLKKITDTDLYYYTEINTPWPVKNRDVPLNIKITQDAATKVMTVESVCVPNYLPVKKDIVRVPMSVAIWKVTPIARDKISISYEIKVDIGGSVPAWLFNMFITKAPFSSFKALKDEIQLPKYYAARFALIKN